MGKSIRNDKRDSLKFNKKDKVKKYSQARKGRKSSGKESFLDFSSELI